YEKLSGISELYHRLVLLAGGSGSGKTAHLRALAAAEDVPLLNLGEQISRRLLDLTEKQGVLQLPRILEEVMTGYPARLTLIDNTEILFNPILQQDPLRLLQGLARDRTIIASWLGSADSGYLTFGVPEHPEFQSYR